MLLPKEVWRMIFKINRKRRMKERIQKFTLLFQPQVPRCTKIDWVFVTTKEYREEKFHFVIMYGLHPQVSVFYKTPSGKVIFHHVIK